MSTFYYGRISSQSQHTDIQIAEFKKQPGYAAENVYIDKVSGVVPFLERKEASILFDKMTSIKGQKTMVVYSWDRMGRSLIGILQVVQLLSERQINIKSIKEGFETLLPDNRPNPISQIMVSTLSSLAQMHRELINDRCRDGIAARKARPGGYPGRKLGSVQTDARLLERHLIIQKKLVKGLTIREINEITGRSTATIIKVKKVMVKRHLI
jgi:DNA invertase Pin-like site-specific DNA recombinase